MIPIFFHILVNDVLPIFVVAMVGLALRRFLRIDSRNLSQVILYALLPCLVFHSLITSQLSFSDFGRMALFTTLTILVIGAVAWLIVRAARLERRIGIAFMFVVMFSNVGNFGLPLVAFAFGQQALAYATVHFVVSNILLYTLGTALISSGQQTFTQAIGRVFRLPVVYAILAAIVVLGSGIAIPQALTRPLELLSRASIPSMLLVLGMQLHQAQFSQPGLLGLTALLRLVVAPACAALLAPLAGLSGAAFQAGIIQSGTPAAVVTSIFAVEFDVAPRFVTNAIFLSTVLSPLTATTLILLLR